jgi:hypothetical protein
VIVGTDKLQPSQWYLIPSQPGSITPGWMLGSQLEANPRYVGKTVIPVSGPGISQTGTVAVDVSMAAQGVTSATPLVTPVPLGASPIEAAQIATNIAEAYPEAAKLAETGELSPSLTEQDKKAYIQMQEAKAVAEGITYLVSEDTVLQGKGLPTTQETIANPEVALSEWDNYTDISIISGNGVYWGVDKSTGKQVMLYDPADPPGSAIKTPPPTDLKSASVVGGGDDIIAKYGEKLDSATASNLLRDANTRSEELSKQVEVLSKESTTLDKTYADLQSKWSQYEQGDTFTGTEAQFKEYQVDWATYNQQADALSQKSTALDVAATSTEKLSKTVVGKYFVELPGGDLMAKDEYNALLPEEQSAAKSGGIKGLQDYQAKAQEAIKYFMADGQMSYEQVLTGIQKYGEADFKAMMVAAHFDNVDGFVADAKAWGKEANWTPGLPFTPSLASAGMKAATLSPAITAESLQAPYLEWQAKVNDKVAEMEQVAKDKPLYLLSGYVYGMMNQEGLDNATKEVLKGALAKSPGQGASAAEITKYWNGLSDAEKQALASGIVAMPTMWEGFYKPLGLTVASMIPGVSIATTVITWKSSPTWAKALSVAGDVVLLAPVLGAVSKSIPVIKNVGKGIEGISISKSVVVPTTEGDVTIWKGLSIDGKTVFGISEGKLSLGRESVRYPELVNIKAGYEPVTKLETYVMAGKTTGATESQLAKLGWSQTEIKKVIATLEERSAFAGKVSPVLEKTYQLPTVERLTQQETAIIFQTTKDYGKQVDRVFGSVSLEPQLVEEFRMWRPKHDIDIDSAMTTTKTEAFVGDMLGRLKAEGGGEYRVAPDSATTIQKKLGGNWTKITEVHSANEVSSLADEVSPTSREGSYGMLHYEKPVRIEYPGIGDIDMMTLSEMGKRKAQSILRWQEGTFAPYEYRTKDIVDFYVIDYTFRGEDAANAWAKSYGFDPANLLKAAGKDPVVVGTWEFIPEAKSSGKVSGTPNVTLYPPKSLLALKTITGKGALPASIKVSSSSLPSSTRGTYSKSIPAISSALPVSVSLKQYKTLYKEVTQYSIPTEYVDKAVSSGAVKATSVSTLSTVGKPSEGRVSIVIKSSGVADKPSQGKTTTAKPSAAAAKGYDSQYKAAAKYTIPAAYVSNIPYGQITSKSYSGKYVPVDYVPANYNVFKYIPTEYIPAKYVPSKYIPEEYAGDKYVPVKYIPEKYIPSGYYPPGYVPPGYVLPGRIPPERIPPASMPPAKPPARLKVPPPKVPPRPPIASKEEKGNNRERILHPKGTVTFQLGELHKDVWHIIEPPYNQAHYSMEISNKPPEGAVVTTVRDVARTIQTLGGKLSRDINIDIGAFDLHIAKAAKRPPFKFTRDVGNRMGHALSAKEARVVSSGMR